MSAYKSSMLDSKKAITEVRRRFTTFLKVHGQLGCQWLFSSEQDVQAHLHHIIYSCCQVGIQNRTLWIGIEAQPRWFLFDEGSEFFKVFGSQTNILRMRKILYKAGAQKRRSIASGRFDIALLASRREGLPHLHVWEIKFFSLGQALRRKFASCKADSLRLIKLKQMLKPCLFITGEVFWIDPYTKGSLLSWNDIAKEIYKWNQTHRAVPIHLWRFSDKGNEIVIGLKY